MVIKPSSPEGYWIEKNVLYIKMSTLYGYYRDIGAGLYHSAIIDGPPGIGKSRGAHEYVTIGGAKVVWPSCKEQQLVDVLWKYRHQRIVMIWDDTDHVFSSAPMMEKFKIVADPSGLRIIEDERKDGHGRFVVNARFIFITNKPINDLALKGFKEKDAIAAMKSRFQLKSSLSFDPIDCYHFSCWMATDGKHLLWKKEFKGQHLGIDRSNEVLQWFADNCNRLEEVSPRTLVDQIADYRLKSPGTWEALAEQWCLPEPRMINGYKMRPQEPWLIDRPTRTQVVVPPDVPSPKAPEPVPVTVPVTAPSVPIREIGITITRIGRGKAPVQVNIDPATWLEAVESARTAGSKLVYGRQCSIFKTTEDPSQREHAAVVIAAYHKAGRLSEKDLSGHKIKAIEIAEKED